MIAVKEFMIQALEDETRGTQGKLKHELMKLFSLIKAAPGYEEAERQNDEEKQVTTLEGEEIRSPEK